jgi:hypothetical protein
MNNEYIIKIEYPLVKAGLSFETVVSENNVLAVTNKLMELVQEINRITKLNSIGAKNPKEPVRDSNAMNCVPLNTSTDFTNFMKNSIDCPDFNIKAPELDRD